MTTMANVCAPLDSLAPAVSRPAERVVLDRAARNSAQAQQAVGVSPSASQIPMAVLVDPAGGEASARKHVHLVILGQIVASSVSVKMVVLVIGSAAASAPPGGMEFTVKSQTGSPRSSMWPQSWSST